ncbi:MAG: hypothetical protein WBG32_00895 [Nodosilinea sp.]
MPSVVIRPALVGKYAIVLEDVATAQDTSAAAILRQLMTDAWGPNLENAPIGQPDKGGPVNPVVMPDNPTRLARQDNPPTPAGQPVKPDDLFGQSA